MDETINRQTGEVIAPEEATPPLTLGTLCRGASEELFQEVLKKAVENIADPNTDATAERKIILTIILTPDDERSTIDADVEVTTKLAPLRGAHGKVFAGLRWGKPFATAFNLAQMPLFQTPAPGPRPTANATTPVVKEGTNG